MSLQYAQNIRSLPLLVAETIAKKYSKNTGGHPQIFGTGGKVPYFHGIIYKCIQKNRLINGEPEDWVQFRKMTNIFRITIMLNKRSRKRSSATDYRSLLQYLGKKYRTIC